MSADIILFWSCVISVVAFFICLILLFTLKDEKAKTAGYAMIGFIVLFVTSLIGYYITKPVDVKP